MSKRFIVSEEEKNKIRKLYLFEEPKEERKFCHSGNVKSLEEIMGDEEDDDYIDGIRMRKNGVRGLVDKLELLKSVRLLKNVSDGGVHLANQIMDNLKSYKPYNYFDETKKECNRAMDKIIELYKENEHGEELVKDIERVFQIKHVSDRAKEFMKHGLDIIKGV